MRHISCRLRAAILAAFVWIGIAFAQTSTGQPGTVTTPAVTACSSCLLEALSPTRLSYPGSVVGSITTVATIIAQPFTDYSGRTVSISYTTILATSVIVAGPLESGEPASGPPTVTHTFSATWSTLGTILTWPTTYLLFKEFSLEPDCTGPISSLSLPLPSGSAIAHLIFPDDESFTDLSYNISTYLESLNLDDHGTDLTKCSFAIGGISKKKAKRRWDTPNYFSFWANPMIRRANTSSAIPSSTTTTAIELATTTSGNTLAKAASCSNTLTTTIYTTITEKHGAPSETNTHSSNSTSLYTSTSQSSSCPIVITVIIPLTVTTTYKSQSSTSSVASVTTTSTSSTSKQSASTKSSTKSSEDASLTTETKPSATTTTPETTTPSTPATTSSTSVRTSTRDTITTTGDTKTSPANPSTPGSTKPPNPITTAKSSLSPGTSTSSSRISFVPGSEPASTPGLATTYKSSVALLTVRETKEPLPYPSSKDSAPSVASVDVGTQPSSNTGARVADTSGQDNVALTSSDGKVAPQVVSIGGSPVTVSYAIPTATEDKHTTGLATQVVSIGSSQATILYATPTNPGGDKLSVSPPTVVIGTQTTRNGVRPTDQVQSSVTPQGVIIGTQTIQAGQTATVNGILVSMPSSGGNIIVGSSTIMINGPQSDNTKPQIMVLASTTITADTEGGFVIASGPSGMTLYTGSSAVVYSGTTYSIASDSPIAVVNGVTVTLDRPSSITTPALLGSPILTFAGKTFTGGISGSSAYFLIPTSILTSAAATHSPVLTLPDGSKITAFVSNNATAFLLGPNAILAPGGQVVLSGTTYRLPTSGSMIEINGMFTTLGGMGNMTHTAKNSSTTATATTGSKTSSTGQQNTGDAIASGLGFTAQPTSASRRLIPDFWTGAWCMVVALTVILWDSL